MKNTLKSNPFLRWLLPFAVVFLALVLRSSYYGFEYYYQLDDYIHFRQLPADMDVVRFCIDKGYFSSRPMAVLFDFIIWSPMNHYLAVVLICAMYAGAAVLYWSVFRRHFGTGWLFVICFALLPLGFEGTYWLAASTRVVPPMLFSALALWCLDRFVEGKNKWLLLPYILSSFISFLLYEQMLVLSLALSLMLMLLHLLRKQWHSLLGLLIFLAVGGYVAFTGHFTVADSSLGSRMNLIFPWQEGYFTTFLPTLLQQMQICFLDGGWATFVPGFFRGLELLFETGSFPILSPLLLAVIPLILLVGKQHSAETKGTSAFWTLIFGFLAFLAPLTPFFILAKPWFCLRNTVPSFLGFALVLDWAARKLTKNRTAALTAVFAAVCLIASISELHDYRVVAKTNEQVATAILQADETTDFSGRVGILGLNQSYNMDQNFTYHDHVLSAHCSDWALEGLVRYYDGRPQIDFHPTPLAVDGEHYWYSWDAATKNVAAYETLLLYTHEAGTLEPLTVQTAGELEWLLYDETGTLCARVWQDEWGYGNIEFFE